MPVLFSSPLIFSISYGTAGWYFPGVTLPSNATAAILRFATSGVSSYASYAVVPRYDAYDDVTEWEMWDIPHNVYVGDIVDWIVPWDGTVPNGKVAYYLNNAGGVSPNVFVLGYFTDSEFVRFDSRNTMPVVGNAPYGVTNIKSYDWYTPEAQAYLVSGSLANLSYNIVPPGWLARKAFAISTISQVFWPDDNGDIWTNAGGDRQVLIGGYFIGGIEKGQYPLCPRAFVAKDKPQSSNNVWLSGYSMGDPRYVLGICTTEYEEISFSGAFAVTRPSGTTSTRWSTLPTDYNFEAMYLYPNSDGQFDVKSQRYDYYNRDRFLLYAAFLRTTAIVENSSAFGDSPVLEGPDIHQGEIPTFAVPIAYTTKSGKYIWSGTFDVRLSGGTANSDPFDSIGGEMSASSAGSDLFGPVTNRMAQTGVVDYRGLYVHNPSAETAYGVLLWLGETSTNGLFFSVGKAPDAELQSIATDEVTPAGVVFSNPSSENTGIWLGNLGPGESVGIWLRRTVAAQNAFSGQETVKLYLSAMNNG
jgi:hypothetical protein